MNDDKSLVVVPIYYCLVATDLGGIRCSASLLFRLTHLNTSFLFIITIINLIIPKISNDIARH